MLQRCKDTNLVLNGEKFHFMVKEGIVLGHKVSGAGLEGDKAKIDVISKLPPPTNVKGIRSFLGHAGKERIAADHLSRIENDETNDDSDVNDNFPRETLMEITTRDIPWFADFADYLENQAYGMARIKSGRMITKDIENMTILEYMEYEAEMKSHPWGYAQSYTRSLRSTTLGRSKVMENKHHLDKLKANAYFPSLPPYFKSPQPLTKNTHEPLDSIDYDLCFPNSHHEYKEVSSDEDVDEWLNAELGKRITEQDKEEQEDAIIDILKTVVEECKIIYKNAQNKASYSRTSEIQGVSFVTRAEEGDRASVNVMPKLLFEHLKLVDLKETSMVVEMADMTKKAPLGIVENVLVKMDKFLFHSDFIVIDMLEGPNKTMLLGKPILATMHAQIDVFRREILLEIGEEKVKFDMNEGICHSRVPFEKIYMASSVSESEYFNPLEIETGVFSYDSLCMKKYAMDDIWEKCERFQATACQWHDEGFEEEEQ
ncbi:copia protein [Tanacetum coccineum]